MGAMPVKNFSVTKSEPGTVVQVKAKSWYTSKTVIFNGILFVATVFIQIVDLLTGQNLLAPTLSLFVKDPAQVTHLIAGLTQIYTLVNLYLRVFKTNTPVTV